MKNTPHIATKPIGWIWVMFGLLTIIFSAPIRKCLELKLGIATTTTSQTTDRKPKMGSRIFKEKQYIVELNQCISNPPPAADIFSPTKYALVFTFPKTVLNSFTRKPVSNNCPLYLSERKLQV